MINLLLSILFSSGIYLIFGVLKRSEISPVKVIIINYFTASLLGFLLNSETLGGAASWPEWLWLSIIMGALFVSVFVLVGYCARNNGMTVATVASKMSMVIPVLYTVIFVREELAGYRLVGFIVAVFAVILTSYKKEASNTARNFLLPLLVFLGSGFVDVAIKASEQYYFAHPLFSLFTPTVFLSAALSGSLIFTLIKRNELKEMTWKILGLGVLLGTTNYFSLHYILLALAEKQFTGPVLFPLNNMGIMIITALVGILIFREYLSRLNYFGFVLAILAVIMMAL